MLCPRQAAEKGSYASLGSSRGSEIFGFLIIPPRSTILVELSFVTLNVEPLNLEQSRLDRLFRIDKTEIEYLIGRDGAA